MRAGNVCHSVRSHGGEATRVRRVEESRASALCGSAIERTLREGSSAPWVCPSFSGTCIVVRRGKALLHGKTGPKSHDRPPPHSLRAGLTALSVVWNLEWRSA